VKFAIRLFAALVAGFFSPQAANAQPGGTREELNGMFASISQKTKWDMSKDMLWGYFFTNSSREKLDLAAIDLSRIGFRIVNVYLSDKKDATTPDLWWLHVERIETHTVESLFKRNVELTAFARTHGLGSYDGMDVGPVLRAKK
jgi:hypothetical protein